MKLLLFSGTHSRHLFVNKEILKLFDQVLVIVMEREELMPEVPSSLTNRDKELFIKHFNNRNKVELSTYGDLNVKSVFSQYETINVSSNKLNTNELANKIKEFNPDFCFIFGVLLILDPVLSVLPQNKINLHLGLSPWYRGAATLYWPFYFLQPQFCGVTFHQINKEADAGEIVHQCVPKLEMGDRIHEVAAKCVLKAADDLPKLINHWKNKKEFKGKIQKTSGRNWRGTDFHASQLRIIYNFFNDDIVDSYLKGELNQIKPNLFSCLT